MAEGGEAPAWVLETQATLGELIKRPKLTPALLQKPPFRFLHDIVSEVTRATGFADGLYDENEQNSGTIKDKESKIAYLQKIISCVEVALGTQIPIRVGKVVAGLEAENTNAFLQQLHAAATTGTDSAGAVAQVLSSAPAQQEAPPPRAPPPPPMPAAADPYAGGGEPQPPMPHGAGQEAHGPDGALQQMQTAPRPQPVEAGDPEETTKRVRPKSARRAPPKVQSHQMQVEQRMPAGEPPPAAGVILEGDAGEDEQGTIEMVDTVSGDAVDTRSMLQDPSGKGHGRLVRNLLDTKNEMEAQATDKERPAAADEAVSDGIILSKKGKSAGGGKLPSKTEVSALRTSIQTLCQSSNPLGRCLEYVQEDLEAMGKELESWRTLRRRRGGELAEEEAATSGQLVGLRSELESVDEKIREKQAQIRFAKASILRNDAQVERLLAQVVRA